MIDLDKLFSDYVTAYVTENLGKKKAEDIEQEMPVLYERWLNETSPEIGTSPLGFIDGLKREGRLVEYARELLEAGVEISDVVGDAFGKEEEEGILALYADFEDYRPVLLAILKNIEDVSKSTEDFFVETALYSTDEALSELAAEALYENHEGAVERILAEIDGLDEDRQLLAFDILYRYPGHDKTLELLLKHLNLGYNVPLFSEFIGSYGDERAIDGLISFAKANPMTKFEFREIRNAVEMLGGDMPEYNYEITN